MLPKLERHAILNMVLITEGALLLIGTVWMWMGKIELAPHLVPHLVPVCIGIGGGLAIAIGDIMLYRLSVRIPSKVFAPIRELIAIMAPMFAEVTLLDVFLIALSSGFCEEIFFRGVLQSVFGLVWSSLMFALVHGPSARLFYYAVWAFVVSILLGLLYIWTGDLWAPIACHAVNNFVAILHLRRITAE